MSSLECQFGGKQHGLIERHARVFDVSAPPQLYPPAIRDVVKGLRCIKISACVIVLRQVLLYSKTLAIEVAHHISSGRIIHYPFRNARLSFYGKLKQFRAFKEAFDAR